VAKFSALMLANLNCVAINRSIDYLARYMSLHGLLKNWVEKRERETQR